MLNDLIQTYALSGHRLTIETPFHAQHLFENGDLEQILGAYKDASSAKFEQLVPLRDAATGQQVVDEDFRGVLRNAVHTTLSVPVYWNKIVDATIELFKDSVYETCTVHVVSSSAAALLSNAISKNCGVTAVTNTITAATQSPQNNAEGRPSADQGSIAVVGYSGRFPESESNEAFWDLLLAGKDVHRTIPEDRFDWKAHYDPTGKTKNTSRVQYGCFIKEPGLFDARFFNISPREAENTDPAQRLAITTTYEALEMSGVVPNRTPSTQQDRVGVFYGTTSDDWREVNSGQNVDTYFIPGGNRAFVPGRIRYEASFLVLAIC